jgi:hypothetical protein
MVPRFIEIKDDLPKNVNDLIQKFILKENWQNIDCRRNTYDTKQKKMAE